MHEVTGYPVGTAAFACCLRKLRYGPYMLHVVMCCNKTLPPDVSPDVLDERHAVQPLQALSLMLQLRQGLMHSQGTIAVRCQLHLADDLSCKRASNTRHTTHFCNGAMQASQLSLQTRQETCTSTINRVPARTTAQEGVCMLLPIELTTWTPNRVRLVH